MTAGLTFRTWTCWQTRGVSARLMKWSLTSRWTIEPLCLRVCSHASLPLAQNTPWGRFAFSADLRPALLFFSLWLWIGKTGLRSLLTGNFFPVLQTHTLSDLTLRSLFLKTFLKRRKNPLSSVEPGLEFPQLFVVGVMNLPPRLSLLCSGDPRPQRTSH